MDEDGCSFFTQENYDYLLESARNYATLMGKELKHNPAKTIGVSIANLYEEFDSIIGKVNLNIEPNGDWLRFILWEYHQWNKYTFFWPPVKFTESLNPRLNKIAHSFIHEFMHSNGIEPLYNSFEIEWILEWARENSCEVDPCDREEYLKIIDSYEHGRVYDLMRGIYSKSYHKNLAAALVRYKPGDGYEKELLNILKKGLQFIGQDKPSIMSYAYDPYYDEECDFHPIDMDRIIRVIYSPKDFVTNELMEYVNIELRESYDISPVTVLYLSPVTSELFSMDDYPERFCNWFNEFCDLIDK